MHTLTCIHTNVQVQLFDKPAEAMAKQMADAIWTNTLPLLAGALALGAATLVTTASHIGPPEATPVLALGALGTLAGGLLPVLKPLLEVQQLSQLSGDQIEAAVDIKEPLQVGNTGCLCITLPFQYGLQGNPSSNPILPFQVRCVLFSSSSCHSDCATYSCTLSLQPAEPACQL